MLLMVRTGASAFWRPLKGKHKNRPSSLQRGAQPADTRPEACVGLQNCLRGCVYIAKPLRMWAFLTTATDLHGIIFFISDSLCCLLSGLMGL